MNILLFIILLFFLIIILFSSKKLSPIPYFPSNKKDLSLIINVLDLKNNQIVVDLGAGDGIVIFNASQKAFEKKLNTQFIAIEINPILILIMQIKRLFHPNKKNIKIIYGDIFKIDIKQLLSFDSKLLTFYLYVSPWYLEKIIKNLKLKIKNFSLVSYFYPLPKIKPKKIIFGVNKIYVYKNL
ncbi:MAG: class I SAM-dependent methyltransferase [Patescibacteria group bacterium]|nr:class I SAM-dependent methyltransferase [Patescibacteria group bacterium]